MASAIDAWRRRVETHHAQSERAEQELPDREDFWEPLADRFREDPRRTGDAVLDRVSREVTSDTTVIDVGGGAGRLALPLALRCGHVTVVEPSESMANALREGAREAGVRNVSIVQATWEEAEADPADVVLCAHVVYGTADIAPFIRKLDSHARERVMVLAFTESPQSLYSPIWHAVHGETRRELPALPELMTVLWEMGIFPDLEMIEEAVTEGSESIQDRLALLRHLTFVEPGTEKDRRLQAVVGEMAEDTPDGLVVRWSRSRRQGLISWRPGQAA